MPPARETMKGPALPIGVLAIAAGAVPLTLQVGVQPAGAEVEAIARGYLVVPAATATAALTSPIGSERAHRAERPMVSGSLNPATTDSNDGEAA